MLVAVLPGELRTFFLCLRHVVYVCRGCVEEREQEILEARLEVWIIYSSQEQEAGEHCCQGCVQVFLEEGGCLHKVRVRAEVGH